MSLAARGNKRIQTLLRIISVAVAGALTGNVFTWLVTRFLIVVLPPLPAADRNSLDSISGLGMLVGFTIGAALTTRRTADESVWLRKLVGAFAIWIGLTLVFVPALSAAALLLFWIRGLPSSSSANSLTFSLLPLIITFPFGIWALGLGWKLAEGPSAREMKAGFLAGCRAVLLPGEGKDFQIITLECSMTRGEFETQLQDLAIPRGLLDTLKARSPLGIGKPVIARATKTGFALSSAKQTIYFLELLPSASIHGVRIEVRSKIQLAHRFFFYYWYGGLALMTPFLIIGGINQAAAGKTDGLLFALFLTLFWTFGLAMLRLQQFYGRRQEKHLLDWLTKMFDARIVRHEPAPRLLWF